MAIFPTRFEGDHGRQVPPAMRRLTIVAETDAEAHDEARRRAKQLADLLDYSVQWTTGNTTGIEHPTPPTISPRRTS